jgi:mRNA interferase RelE/StbE
LPEWDAVIAPAAAKSLRKLPRNERERILAAIERLPAGDVRSLKGRGGEWRLRVGDWRALIRLDSTARVIVVTAVKPRGGAYDR